MSLVGPSMPVDVHHSGPGAHRELAKKSLEDREILGHGCGVYLRISRALRLIRGVGGTQGQLSESDPMWAADRVARHGTRRGSTWVDHMQSEWHVTGARVMWDFRGGGRTTCRGKSRGDGWDHYNVRFVGFVVSCLSLNQLCPEWVPFSSLYSYARNSMCSYLSVSGFFIQYPRSSGSLFQWASFDTCDGRSLELLVWTSWYVLY